MPTTVTKIIGTGGDYSTLAAWMILVAASDLTATRSSTCGSGSTTTAIVLDAAASATDGFYNGHPITIGGATHSITAYVGSTKTATVDAAFASAPTSGTAYSIDSVIYQGKIKNQTFGGAGAGQVLHIPACVTSSACYVELTTDTGASFADNASVQTNALRANASNGALITSDANFNSVVQVSANYTRLSKLQIESTGTSSASALLSDAASGNILINRCICENNSAANYALDGSTSISTLTNNLFINRSAAATAVIKLFGDWIAVNNTIVTPIGMTAPTSAIDFSFPVNVTLRNNAIFCSGAPVWDTAPTGTLTSQTNLTDMASPPAGFTQIAYDSSSGSGFQNITSGARDYRIKSTSALKDAGTTDATNAPLDIAGTARPSGTAFDVGAWEFVVTGSAVPVLAMNHYRQRA